MKKRAIMTEAGRRIGIIKGKLLPAIKVGATPRQIDFLADQLICADGDYPSFKTVRGYHHATCININSGLVHGIPNDVPFKPSDVVTVDLGLVHQGFHVDTSFTVQIPPQDPETQKFLKIGRQALDAAISQAMPGNSLFQISEAMEQVLVSAGYSPIRDLTGHGIGRSLHLSPSIFCYARPSDKRIIIQPNQTLAIEAMYAMGDYRLKEDSDGWTLSTADGSLSGMFEETVYITQSNHEILTTTTPLA